MLLLVLVLGGCDRAPSSTAVPTSQAASRAPLPPMQCDLSIVSPLLPRRATHVAVDPASNVYFVQETDDGGDGMFVIGMSDISKATVLSSVNVLAQMNAKGSGNIQSIAAGADGNVYFYFAGGSKRQTLACLGRFEPRSGQIRILAREPEIASTSGMGLSLTLARGTLVAAGNAVWFWLRHTDSSLLLNLRVRDLPAEGEIKLPRPTPIRSADGTLNLTRDGLRLSSGQGDDMLLIDTWSGALWKIDLTGAADVMQTLVGLPKQLSAAGAHRAGDVMFFAAPSDSIQPRVEARVIPVDLVTRYPALLILHNGALSAIPQDDIHADATFPLFAMQLEQTVYEPGRDTWIGYDSASGNVVRMKLSQKRSR